MVRRGLVFGLCLGVSQVAQAGPGAAPDVARGAYLVEIAACAGCHTPQAPAGLGPAFSGGRRFGVGPAASVSANITPDRATGIGSWSDAQIAAAIHDGVRPDGSRIAPPMPQVAYRAMRDDDVRAIVAYLRTVPPVVHAVATAPRDVPTPRVAAPAVAADGSRKNGQTPEDLVAKGQYLANAVTHCTECHTPGPLAAPDFASRLDTGGRIFPTRDGPVAAASITAASLRHFSDAELASIITRGRKPDGTTLRGPMPVAAYAKLRREDLEAIIAFLRAP